MSSCVPTLSPIEVINLEDKVTVEFTDSPMLLSVLEQGGLDGDSPAPSSTILVDGDTRLT